jgi:hypothetical protein
MCRSPPSGSIGDVVIQKTRHRSELLRELPAVLLEDVANDHPRAFLDQLAGFLRALAACGVFHDDILVSEARHSGSVSCAAMGPDGSDLLRRGRCRR